MKKGKLKYVVLSTIAFLITPTTLEKVADLRNGFYIGGEWLLVPLAILIGLFIDSCKDFLSATKEATEYDR